MTAHQPLQATRGDGVALCGNSRHPNGAWHRATALPFYPGALALFSRRGRAQRREVKRFENRRRLWGCGCQVI